MNDPDTPGSLRHIGSYDFNFDVDRAVLYGDDQQFIGLKASLNELRQKYDCQSVRILSPATEECWASVPRTVYEDTAEREAHVQLLMKGVSRQELETTWFPLSNIDHRQLLIRRTEAMKGFQKLLGSFSFAEFVAEFEIGNEWQHHTNASGSFLFVYCRRNYLSVSSHVLGKLRGSTVIRFESRTDLPYLWAMYANTLTWMRGIHEQVYVHGNYARRATEALRPFWDDTGDVFIMNNLETMSVTSEEETYGFPLESAFPAVLLSLNASDKQEDVHANHNG
ncbi:MAG: hypothetical protein ACNA78_08400 [Balneolaceae bacterium]